MNPSGTHNGHEQSSIQSPLGREEFLLCAESYLKQDRYRDAMALAMERISLYPGDADARLIFGIALLKTGREKEALTVFEEIGKDIRRWACVFEYLGDIFGKKGERENARDCYQFLVSLAPNSIETERLLRKIDALMNVEKESDEKLSSGVSGDFNTITMAELYLKQGHIELAEKVLKEILQNEPGNDKAAELLRQVRAVSKKIAGRERTFSDTVIGELNRWLRNLQRLKSD